ncbi:MAG: DUF29 domain-containing protein [Spirulinaceae cyanobacterium RM2_2_10]|nr:DUF29 domain-containing protein [Spirulinaceae cyanobacterium SM2_1_0]NJO21395.1 DUF29 domain-containing protein [Spirulinaceae cyanobacterium RM2_2_10]
MNAEIKLQAASRSDSDYQCWLDQTVAQLREKDFSHLDLDNLIEEIEGLGRSEKREISSDLMRLCEHLLKIKYWEFERADYFRIWDREIVNFRLQIQEQLAISLSLSPCLKDNSQKQYQNGRKLFIKASHLDASLISKEPEFTLEQALDEALLDLR